MNSDDLEVLANIQLVICKDVICDLEELSTVSPYDCGGFIWTLAQGDYCAANHHGTIKIYELGRGGDPTRSLDEFYTDENIGDVKYQKEYRAQFRAACLPKFNRTRELKRYRVEAEMQRLGAQLQRLQGDIE